MYYDKKSTFYIKQYGPAALVITISLVLLLAGTFIYFKTSKPNEVVNNNQIEDTNKNNESNNNYNLAENTSEFNSLDAGVISKEYKVLEVKDVSTIVIDMGNNKATEIKLIGVRETKPETSGNDSLQQTFNKMKSDLVNKNIKLSFDTNKTENKSTYSYVYLNDQLYNETILKEGFAELRPEKYNINKLDILLSAEKMAKVNDAGIWK